MVQSRISPGLTTIDLSKDTRPESRTTDPESCIFTSGRSALESMKCFCAKAPAPSASNENVASVIATNFFFDFNILFVSLDGWTRFEDFRSHDRILEGLPTPCSSDWAIGRETIDRSFLYKPHAASTVDALADCNVKSPK